MMTYQEFIEKVKALGYSVPALEQPVPDKYRENFYFDVGMVRWRDDNFNYKMVPALALRWVIGGSSGGSCWGDKSDQPVMGEREPPWETLDKILEALCPNISFLHYKRIMELAGYETTSDGGDWYGNYYQYGVRVLPLFKLYDYLIERKLIGED